MDKKVIIYGKDGWGYTSDARRAYGEKADYVDVKKDPVKLEEMLKLSGGSRRVPVIVKGDTVEIGYGGTWGVWKRTVGPFVPAGSVFQDVIPSDGKRDPGCARTGRPFRIDKLVKSN